MVLICVVAILGGISEHPSALRRPGGGSRGAERIPHRRVVPWQLGPRAAAAYALCLSSRRRSCWRGWCRSGCKLPPLRRLGVSLRPAWDVRSEPFRRVLLLMGPDDPGTDRHADQHLDQRLHRSVAVRLGREGRVLLPAGPCDPIPSLGRGGVAPVLRAAALPASAGPVRRFSGDRHLPRHERRCGQAGLRFPRPDHILGHAMHDLRRAARHGGSAADQPARSWRSFWSGANSPAPTPSRPP